MIEAGLGGRYDATNVIPSRVQVLTSVGLEHTRWLGPTLTDIAGEKLDVVQPGATLVLGAGLDPEVARGRRAGRAPSARPAIVQAGIEPGVEVGAPGAYQRRNFALALSRGRRPISGRARRARGRARPRPRCGCPAACSRSAPTR